MPFTILEALLPATLSAPPMTDHQFADFEGYWHLCPAFVIELRSHSDKLPVLRAKLQEYTADGARLGWMIDPETRTVEVYRPDRESELLAGVDSVSGEGPVQGFVQWASCWSCEQFGIRWKPDTLKNGSRTA